MRVWLSGASGFAGRCCTALLRAEGQCVIGPARPRVDVTRPETVAVALATARPDAILHLAGLASVSASYGDPAAAARTNYLGTASLLRAAARESPRARIVLVSSGEIYGGCRAGATPLDEATPLRPRSPYARTKAAADLLGRHYAARGFAVLCARAFNHIGPGQSAAFAASGFAKQIAEIECGLRPRRLRVGNLSAVRDFLDVRDVAEAYRTLLLGDAPPGAYNVCSGVGVSLRELLEQLLQHSDVDPAIEVDAKLWRPTPASVGSPARLRAQTGWTPTLPLAQTLRDLLEDWRRRVRAAAAQ